jgi:RNA polymerase sigma-70 factor, ECF subfamily
MSPYAIYSDCELIIKFKEGCPIASEEIYLRFYPGIVKVCAQYLRSIEDGCDAAQEVFLKVISQKKLLSYRGEAKLWSWIRRIAVNLCHEIAQKRKQEKDIHCLMNGYYETLCEMVPSQKLNPEECIAKEEEQQHLKLLTRMLGTSLEELPDNYRSAIHLKYFEGFSYKETAYRLGLPVHILGVHLFRGKQMLLQKIEKERS